MSTVAMTLAPVHREPPPAVAFTELEHVAAQLEPVIRALVAHVLRERRSHPDVEDCCHEVFIRAAEARARWNEALPLRPWVLGIARHVALDALRRRHREAVRLAPADRAPSSSRPALLERLADPAPGPDGRLTREEQAERVRRALGTLQPELRRAMWLFHVEGLGYRDIAAKLDVPVGTVGTWVMRGRQKLARALEQERSAP
jgi:RNA polymerase sigma-70 factor (ECF subfamily)